MSHLGHLSPWTAPPAVDPERHAKSLCLAVRTLPSTNVALQKIVTANGLTFWGCAIAQIFDCAAYAPEQFMFTDLEYVPPQLFGGGDFVTRSAQTSRGVCCPMTSNGLALIRAWADHSCVSPERFAARFIWRNASHAQEIMEAMRGLVQ